MYVELFIYSLFRSVIVFHCSDFFIFTFYSVALLAHLLIWFYLYVFIFIYNKYNITMLYVILFFDFLCVLSY